MSIFRATVGANSRYDKETDSFYAIEQVRFNDKDLTKISAAQAMKLIQKETKHLSEARFLFRKNTASWYVQHIDIVIKGKRPSTEEEIARYFKRQLKKTTPTEDVPWHLAPKIAPTTSAPPKSSW
jgi:hypothetical protein